MQLRRWLVAGTILAAAAAVPALAGADNPPGYDSTSGFMAQELAHEVSAADVIAASKLPGADSDGVSSLTDLSTTAVGAEAPMSGEVVRCWTWDPRAKKGTWPYSRVVVQHTYWCGGQSSHKITARTTTTTHDNGPGCQGTGDVNYLISGGVGLSWVKIHSQSYFTCYIAGPPLSDNVWEEPSYNWSGGYAIEGCNGSCG